MDLGSTRGGKKTLAWFCLGRSLIFPMLNPLSGNMLHLFQVLKQIQVFFRAKLSIFVEEVGTEITAHWASPSNSSKIFKESFNSKNSTHPARHKPENTSGYNFNRSLRNVKFPKGLKHLTFGSAPSAAFHRGSPVGPDGWNGPVDQTWNVLGGALIRKEPRTSLLVAIEATSSSWPYY